MTAYDRLEDVILDENFPEVDLALRRGQHIDRDDGPWYNLLSDAGALLETFYRRYGGELIHKSDGYYYLLPTNDRLGRRHLSIAEMLVGQALTLLYLDPRAMESGGVVTREQLLTQLSSVLGIEGLIRALNPKRRRYDERVAEETVRSRVSEAVRRLSTLGFLELLEEQSMRLRPALMRFAEPVRTSAAPDVALTKLVAAGELAFAEPEAGEELGSDELLDEVAIDGAEWADIGQSPNSIAGADSAGSESNPKDAEEQ